MTIEDILDTTNGDYIQLGLKAPLFKGATIRTLEYRNKEEKILSDLKRYGEYAYYELLMQNFVMDDKSSEMWVHELVDAVVDYFGTERIMSVKEFYDICREFCAYMGDDTEYGIMYYDAADELGLAENEAAFFAEFEGRDGELVDATFVVEFEGLDEKLGYDEDEYENTNTTRTQRHNVDYPSNVTLPLSGGFTKEQEKAYERGLGSNWRDLFNGL